jgi:hypothetical protein
MLKQVLQQTLVATADTAIDAEAATALELGDILKDGRQ